MLLLPPSIGRIVLSVISSLSSGSVWGSFARRGTEAPSVWKAFLIMFVARRLALPLLSIVFPLTVFLSSSNGEGFRIRPHVTNVTDTTATLRWAGVSPSIGRVAYGQSMPMAYCAVEEVPSAVHRVCIRGLEPGTVYIYRIREGAEEVTRLFRTPRTKNATLRRQQSACLHNDTPRQEPSNS